MRSVGVAKLDHFQRFSLEIEGLSFEDFGRNQLRWKLARKARFPDGLDKLRFDLFSNGRNDGRAGDCSCVRERVKQLLQTEIVVAMGVSDVNGRKIFPAINYPIQQLL